MVVSLDEYTYPPLPFLLLFFIDLYIACLIGSNDIAVM